MDIDDISLMEDNPNVTFRLEAPIFPTKRACKSVEFDVTGASSDESFGADSNASQKGRGRADGFQHVTLRQKLTFDIEFLHLSST